MIDPDYAFTNAYGLRWNAPRETAYLSTFVLERSGRVRFAQISKSHGGRVSAENALAALPWNLRSPCSVRRACPLASAATGTTCVALKELSELP